MALKAFLAAIDRSTPKGRRDYAMFLLIATYGLRAARSSPCGWTTSSGGRAGFA
ncbi:MAG: hypothetical protein ACRDH5_06835 [bacterium]